RCVGATQSAMGESLGRAYVSTRFSPESKVEASKTVQQIEAAFEHVLEDTTWMDGQTKKQAFDKLHKVFNQIGYPDKWRSFAALKFDRAHYLKNLLSAEVFDSRYELDKIDKPVDKSEWGMYPQTVNAYYSGEKNKMVFPAGILQPPFFSKDAPYAVNYG